MVRVYFYWEYVSAVINLYAVMRGGHFDKQEVFMHQTQRLYLRRMCSKSDRAVGGLFALAVRVLFSIVYWYQY